MLFVASVNKRKQNKEEESTKKGMAVKWGIVIAFIGLIFQIAYFTTRWIAVGHPPVSNMFEYLTFFGMMIVVGSFVIYFIYRNTLVALFSLPISMVIIAYASVFPTDIKPLVPGLQNYWLPIHVSTVALGQGLLTISFIAGLIYLLAVTNQSKSSKQTRMIEVVMYGILSIVAFAVIVLSFEIVKYEQTFTWQNEQEQSLELTYSMPAIIAPNDSQVVGDAGGFTSLVEAPAWMKGVNAARKLNSFVWAMLGGLVLYGMIRFILRKRIGAAIQPLLKNVRPTLLDEIGYRSVAIGFPIFVLGGLVFAMIYALDAWSRLWGWDPKEIGALVTALFYAAYLHLRISRGWQGNRSAWLAVIGFIIIMLNTVFVNLVIAGLHSYA